MDDAPIARKYTSFDEMKADEYRYWQSRPAYERLDAVEEMIQVAYDARLIFACSGTGGQGGAGESGSSGGGRNGWTNKIARQKAAELGYEEAKDAPFDSRNQLTFKSGTGWITPDIDGHTGYQTWKLFDSSGNRLGTYNTDLTVRLGK
jgi:hypothetical protein